jgi:p-hydroxybenzoate 3-monooxygenase
MRREGAVHRGVRLRFAGRTHRLDFPSLAGGRSIVLYPQHELLKDLVAARLAAGGTIHFEVEDVEVSGLDGDAPTLRWRDAAGAPRELTCAAIAGCDGFHGVCRPAIPAAALVEHVRDYPFAWLGMLVEAPASTEELIYARHERGFALVSTRTPRIQRLYLQCAPDDPLEAWPDERIWEELHARLATDEPGWRLVEGRIFAKGVIGMRSYVVEPMQWGRLYLAGDAAHIVPPTGAKGLNLAISDVAELAAGLTAFLARGDGRRLDGYSRTVLRRVWRAQHFASWMTTLLHRFPDADPFAARLQLAELDALVSSPAAQAALAEQYVGAF